MAKDKERSVNPATAHLKAEKAKALKKSKANLATLRTERLSRRNPDRLQRQLDELLAEEAASGGKLRPRDREAKERLERDIKAVRSAREKLGAPEREREHHRDDGNGGVLGKRSRGDDVGGDGAGRDRQHRRHEHHRDGYASDASDATDLEVRGIPMPRDTPPPVPRRLRAHQRHELPQRPDAPQIPAQTTYSSAPQIRNLQKEATAAFVPAAVAARLKQTQMQKGGQGIEPGTLLELEEVEALEKAGYLPAPQQVNGLPGSRAASTLDDAERRRLQAEEEQFERELREAELEVAEEAGSKVEIHMMAEREEMAQGGRNCGSEIGTQGQTMSAERHLRRVEMEEVVDEEA